MTESELDFTPFDAEKNLSAVNEVLRAVRHMSWSYAGDITRVVKKITQTFDAGRCILFAVREGERFDVYEYAEKDINPLSSFFNSPEGQQLLHNLVELGVDLISADSFIEMNKNSALKFAGELPDQLQDPPSHIVPLKNPYTSRYGIKPGFMLIQEPRGLNRWNKKQLNSLFVIAEYIAMTIECERLTSAMQIETALGAKIPGILSRRKFSDLVEWELSRARELDLKPVLLLVGFPERTKLSLPQLIRDANVIFDRCAQALVEAKGEIDLAGYWKGDLITAFSTEGGDQFIEELQSKIAAAFQQWAQESGVGATMEGIPAFGIARFPQDGETLEKLYLKALANAKL